MSIEVIDPSHESDAREYALAERLGRLRGKTVGIVSNGKKGTVPFFDAFEDALVEGHGVAKVVRVTKANYSAPAEPEIMAEAQRWDALIAGIGD